MEEDSLQNIQSETLSSNPTSIAYEKFLPVLVQCFAVIFLGYVSGRFGIMTSTESKGLGIFVRYFCLPSLIFNTLMKIEFSNVNWRFLACIFIAKLCIFIIVIVITLILTKPTNVGKAGLYAIFSTQSNDFALGYPLLLTLYSKWHPEYSQYLYLIAPMQLALLNPFAYILMNIQQTKESDQNNKVQSCWFKAYFGFAANPIIVMTFLGIFGNILFHHKLPLIISQLLDVFGTAYPACALFLLGHNIVGTFKLLKGITFIVPILLISAKILILPLLIRELVIHLANDGTTEENKDLSNFGFLYGTFPTAPTVFIFATQYEMSTEIVAPGMVACTMLSAPLMFVSASMTTLQMSNLSSFHNDLISTLTCTSILGFMCSCWVFIIFIIGKKWKFVIHKITFLLIFSQILVSLGGILWSFINVKHHWAFYVQYVLSAGGIFSSRIWTSLLALALALLHWRSLCFVYRIYKYMIYFGFIATIMVVTILAIKMRNFLPDKTKIDPSFQFGEAQASVAFIVIFFSLTVTIISLIIQQHYSSKSFAFHLCINEESESKTDVLKKHPYETDETVLKTLNKSVGQGEESEEIEDLISVNEIDESEILLNKYQYSPMCGNHFRCSSEQRRKCSVLIKNHSVSFERFDSETDLTKQENDYDQILRCIILLLLLCISLIVGLAICLWKLFLEATTGIYVELEFLDVILNYGQGIISFFVFGLDAEVVVQPCIQIWNYVKKDYHLNLGKTDLSSFETDQVCEQFIIYHRDKCIKELETNKRIGKDLYGSVFTGQKLVDWLLAVGLAKDRREATNYGQHLLLGNVIRHVDEKPFFCDNLYFYTFFPKDRS
ncbi:lysosomal cholesterol signaling protein-like [Centruroides vittatus]|uniref:lysosomal cholesterol signaling protein-like n=1 Tax=Centruroides vittatus TaxID=120091 RepID=UPI00350F6975